MHSWISDACWSQIGWSTFGIVGWSQTLVGTNPHDILEPPKPSKTIQNHQGKSKQPSSTIQKAFKKSTAHRQPSQTSPDHHPNVKVDKKPCLHFSITVWLLSVRPWSFPACRSVVCDFQCSGMEMGPWGANIVEHLEQHIITQVFVFVLFLVGLRGLQVQGTHKILYGLMLTDLWDGSLPFRHVWNV